MRKDTLFKKKNYDMFFSTPTLRNQRKMSLSDVICFTPGATGLDKEKAGKLELR